MLYLGTNIKEHRLKKGYTQERLAYELGVSSQTVSRWETGTTYPDIVMLPIIAALFDTSIDNLMGYAKECSTKEREEFSAEEKLWQYRFYKEFHFGRRYMNGYYKQVNERCRFSTMDLHIRKLSVSLHPIMCTGVPAEHAL